MRISLSFLMCGGACLAISAALPLEAGIVPKGPAFVVNTETVSSSFWPGYLGSAPRAAVDARERFIVVWATAYGSHVKVRPYDRQKRGARPFKVTTSSLAEAEYQPDVAVDGSGRSVIVWTTGSEVWGRRLMRKGPLDEPFRIDSSTSHFLRSPSVSASSSGAFVVVWNETLGDLEGNQVRARRFDETGNPVESDFLVSRIGRGGDSTEVGMNASGGFVVVYVKRGVDGYGHIFASVFDDHGALVRPEFQVTAEVTSDQFSPGMAMDAAGNFVVVWAAAIDQGLLRKVFAKRFDASGSPLGSEFLVDEESSGYFVSPAVSMGTAGEFVVAWNSGSDYGAIQVRSFDASGRPTGQSSTVVPEDPHNRSIRPEVAMRPSGDFVVLWSSFSSSLVRSRVRVTTSIHGREFNGRAPEVTDPAQLGTLDCSDPLNVQPTFSWLGGGYDRFRVILSWEESFREGARISSGEPLLTTTSWTPDPEAWWRVCEVTMHQPREAPSVHVRIVGVETDSGSENSERTQLGPTTSYYVLTE